MNYEDLPQTGRVGLLAITGAIIAVIGALVLVGVGSWWAVAGGVLVYGGGALRGGAAGIESVARAFLDAHNRNIGP